MKDPRATVAIILAAAILVFMISGTFMRELIAGLGGPILVADPEIAAKWENVISVIVGVLAGYIAGRDSEK